MLKSALGCKLAFAVLLAAALGFASFDSTIRANPAGRSTGMMRPAMFAHMRHGRRVRNNLTAVGPIMHVVVVVMENRTVDNLLQTVPGAKVTGSCMQGSSAIPLGPVSLYGQQEPSSAPTGPMYDPTHRHLPAGIPVPSPSQSYLPGTGFVADYDNAQNDGWNCASPQPAPSPTIYYDGAYVPYNDIKPYADLAAKWTVADEVYQGNQGPSFVAHQYLIAGQSGGHHNYVPSPSPGPIVTAPGTFSESENPAGDIYRAPGCEPTSAPPTVASLDMSSPYPGAETLGEVPCYDYETIFDLLDAVAGSGQPNWNYYVPTTKIIWNAPYDVKHLYNNRYSNVVYDPGSSQFFDDVASGNLAPLSYIIPCAGWSDHPALVSPEPNPTIHNGPNFVNFIVNTIGLSAQNVGNGLGGKDYWAGEPTTIIVIWDDWGGFYDHFVPPHSPNPIYDGPGTPDPNEFGYRIPMFVISPFLRASTGCFDHYPDSYGCIGPRPPSGITGLRTQGSILHYIETTFGLGSLGTEDGESDDLSEMFNTTTGRTPIPFSSISPSDAPTGAFPLGGCTPPPPGAFHRNPSIHRPSTRKREPVH